MLFTVLQINPHPLMCGGRSRFRIACLKLRADAVRLRQILLNLLSNAKKYTQQGEITLGAEVNPPDIHLWVSDTGLGIDSEHKEQIFEPFVTIEDNRQIAGGIGLGLSITRHLVALHGGSMKMDSIPGKGSTFHIYLPLPALGSHDFQKTIQIVLGLTAHFIL